MACHECNTFISRCGGLTAQNKLLREELAQESEALELACQEIARSTGRSNYAIDILKEDFRKSAKAS